MHPAAPDLIRGPDPKGDVHGSRPRIKSGAAWGWGCRGLPERLHHAEIAHCSTPCSARSVLIRATASSGSANSRAASAKRNTAA